MTGPENAWESAPAGLGIVDRDLRLVAANKSLEALIGCTEDSAVGNNFVELLGADDRFADSLRKAFGGQRLGPLATRCGETPLIFSCWLAGSDPELLAMACYEACALTGAEPMERFRLLAAAVEQSPDAVFIKDRQGRHLLVNPACAEIIGKDAGEILGRDVSALFPAEVVEMITTMDRQVLEHGHDQVMEEPIFHQTRGEKRIYRSRKIPYRDADGEIVGLIGFGRDVTERRQVEQGLRDSEAKFRGLIEQATDAFFLHSLEGEFFDVNEQACRSLGYTRDELLGMRVPDIELDWPMGRLEEEVGDVLKSLPATLQGRHRRKDGSIFPVEVRLGWVNLGGKEMLLGLARDITERKAAEELLKEAQRELEERVRVRTRDLQEANQSLSVEIEERTRIEGQLRQSQRALRRNREQLRELAGRLLDTQEDERRRLAGELHDDLTQRLAALSIESGRIWEAGVDLPPEIAQGLEAITDHCVELSVDIHRMARRLHPSILDDLGLVDAIRSECEAFAERHGVELSSDVDAVPDDLPPAIALCLYRVTQEALNNVAKHSGATKVSLRLKAADSRLALTISDNGQGFDAARPAPGLGLVSMRERARRLRGQLKIESSESDGTTLTIDLPARFEATPA